MTRYVLDSSAALAVVLHEPGGDEVRALLDQCVIGAVNYCEVASKLLVRIPDAAARAFVLDHYAPKVIAFGAEQARLAGAMIELTRPYGLSLGDRACLALAKMRGAVALTTDQAWRLVDVGVTVELIR